MELPTAQDHNSFYLGDKKVMNLKEMYEEMTNPDNADAAKSHIEGERNDYSTWIKEVLNDEDLASKIAEKSEVSEIAQLIKEKIDLAPAESSEETSSQDQIEPQQPVQQASSDAPISSSIPQEEQLQESKPDASEQAAGQPVEDEKKPSEEEQPKEESEKQPEKEVEDKQSDEIVSDDNSKPLEPPPDSGDIKKEDAPKVKDESALEKVEEGAKEVVKKVDSSARHFCPKFFECMKKEFLFGLGLGIIVGIVFTIIMRMAF